MNWISYLSNALIPLLFACILAYGLFRRIRLFDCFTHGAEEGLRIVVKLLPTYIGLFMAVSCMRASGFLDWIAALAAPVGEFLHFPSILIPIALTKFISSSAATGMALDVFATYGPDAAVSEMTAVMIGSTETILYTISVYYMTIHIRKTHWTFTGAVIAFIVGIAASIILVNSL